MTYLVTELRQTRPERYTLGLDSGESFSVSLNLTADFSLYPGRELTERELEELRAAAARAGTRERAMRIISQRAMSQGELYRRLLDKGEDPRAAAETVAWLVGLHFLDDTAYAASVVRHYAARGYGARRIENELYRRKVPRELWAEALEELPEPEDTLDRLLRSRLGPGDPDRKAVKKAADYLLRRGFSWEEVRAALARRDPDRSNGEEFDGEYD